MFERFTPRARRAVVLAQNTAREMGHRQIKPEHLLVGLREGEGMAANAMAQCGVNREVLRQKVIDRIDHHPSARKVERVPFSTEAKKALELSLRAALALGHNYIGTEHLFFGAQREAEHRDQTLDDLLGVSTADVHNRLMDMLGNATAEPSTRSPALRSAMDSARRAADHTPMTTGHLLTAILAETDSQAARALAALGLTGEAVHVALDRVPLADTSDAPASPKSVTITIGNTTRLISDPDLATALEELSADQLRDAIKKAMELTDPDQATG